MGEYFDYWYDAELKKVELVQPLHVCAIFGCEKNACYTIVFEDSTTIDVCEEHRPIKFDGT